MRTTVCESADLTLQNTANDNIAYNNTKSLLKCVYFNSRSVCNKLNELHYLLYHQKPDVVIISETWLNSLTVDGLLDPENCYKIFRRDRSTGRGGGVCILILKCYTAYEIVTSCPPDVELISVDIVVCGLKLRLVGLYRSPGYNKAMVTLANELRTQLDYLTNVRQPVFIAGDFNCPDVKWTTFEAPNDSVQDVLADFFVLLVLHSL